MKKNAGKAGSRDGKQPGGGAGKKRPMGKTRPRECDPAQLIDALGARVFVADRNLRIECMNDAARKRYGRDAAGALCHEVLFGLDRRCPWCDAERVLRGETIRKEILNQKDHRWYDFVSAPLYREDGSVSIQSLVFDITDCKEARDRLRASEEKYRVLFENPFMGIFQSTPEGRFITVNPAAARMCGYDSPEEMVAAIDDIATRFYVDPQERARFIEALEERGFVRNFEHRSYRKGGSILWASVSARVVKDGRGNALYYEGTIEDVTRRREVEEKSRQSEEQFSRAFRSNPGPMLIAAIDEGRILDANERAAELYGYSREEMIGRTPTELGFWEDPAEGERLIGKLREDGFLKNVPVRQRNKSGEIRMTLWSAEIIRLGDGEAVLSLHHDVTERKEAEEALKESERKLLDIVDFLPDATLVIDRSGRVIAWNRAIENMTGVKAIDMLGKDNYEYALPFYGERRPILADLVFQRHEEIEKKYAFIKREDDILYTETDVPRVKGESRILWGKARPLYDSQGNVIGSIETIRDMTERKRMEEALRDSEERFRSLFENMIVGVFQSTPEGRYIAVNEACARMFGYDSPKQMIREVTRIGEQIFANPEDRARCLLILNETGRLERFEAQTRRRDGGLMWCSINSRAVRDESGTFLHMEGTVQDITERKLAEEALHASEARYRELTDYIPIGIFEASIDGGVTYANRTGLEMFGFVRDDLARGVNVLDVIDPADHAKARDYIRDVLSGSVLILREYTLRKKNGTQFPGLAMSRPIVQDGKITGISGVVSDIGELKRAQEALRQSEALLRSILRASPTGVGMVHNRVLTWVNEAVLKMTGYSAAELEGKSARVLYADDGEFERVGRVKYAQIARRGMGTVETRWQRKDGTILDVHLSSAPIDPQNLDAGVVFTAADITEQKRAEETRATLEIQLRQAQKMEAIGTLAGGIAHDFNNILFAVVGYTELCLAGMPEGNLHRNLSQILSACDRAKNLVSQILAFSRQSEQERRPSDIVPIAREALRFLRSSLPATIELCQDFQCKACTVLTGPVPIHQILLNLCTNAAHAMRERGGILTVGLRRLDLPEAGKEPIAGLPPGTYAELTVRDTGHGIDRVIMNRLFDPFFTTKAPGEGTGLGLSVVYGIVKMHGGTIRVESEIGRGSTFRVYLPMVSPTPGPEEKEAGDPVPGGSEHILFVDDEKILVEMMERMLTVLGYRVTAHANSVDALQTFLDDPGRFDLVITDMTMPGMTGLELAEEILRARPGMPIILCTGYSELIDEREALRQGIRRFLMKPIFTGDLAREVRAILDEHRKER